MGTGWQFIFFWLYYYDILEGTCGVTLDLGAPTVLSAWFIT